MNDAEYEAGRKTGMEWMAEVLKQCAYKNEEAEKRLDSKIKEFTGHGGILSVLNEGFISGAREELIARRHR
jgi:hypothetical protein